jgi:hypothetical protein
MESAMREDVCNCKHELFYDSLPKDKVGVGLVSNPGFQLKLSQSPAAEQHNGRHYIASAQTADTVTYRCKERQRALLKNRDKIKVDAVGSDAKDGQTFVSDDVSRRDEAVLDKSDIRDDAHFEFIVNMLCNNEV